VIAVFKLTATSLKTKAHLPLINALRFLNFIICTIVACCSVYATRSCHVILSIKTI